MSEVFERYSRVADGFGARLGTLTAEQWSSSTPCTEWTVRDLVAHVINTHRRVLAALDGSTPEDVDGTATLAAEWSSASEAVGSALAEPETASRTVSGMFGEQPFESLVSRLLCADTIFHTWDLARATGQDETLDEAAVVKAMEFLEPLDEAIRRPGGFAPKIAAPPAADVQTRLLCFGGRAV